MADDDTTDDSQKTEEPTAKRLEEARKNGQVVFSREITVWVGLFTSTVLLVMAGPGIMSELSDQLKTFISMPHAMDIGGEGLRNTLAGLLFTAVKVTALPFFILAFAGILSAFLQTGVLLTFEPIKPDLSKISIFKGIDRLFSGRSVAELVKGILKIIIISTAATLTLTPYFGGIEHFVGLDVGQSLFDLREMFLKMMIAALSILFVVAILDYIYQRHVFMKQLRMSRQEMKDEFRQTEGDPMVKAQLRRLREKKARERMMQAVPEADVVITNPTHYAVALKYDTKEMDAPVMVAKGADIMALRIKEVAKENKVPVVENAPLARALFESMEIDQMIPNEHWKAVAEVISYVFKLKGRKV